jgi:hypothetical protein
MPDSMLRTALFVSAAVHGLFGVWVAVSGLAHPPVFHEVADSWTGPGIEVDAVPLSATPTGEPTNTSEKAPLETSSRAASRASSTARATRTAPAATEHESAPAAPEPVTATHGEPASRTSVVTHAIATARTVTASSASKAASPVAKRPATPSSDAAPTRAASSDAAPGKAPSTAASGSPSDNGVASGAFGAQGLPVGVRHLPKAFTRALSIADRSDPRWLTLAPGPAGEARVQIAIDDDGKLGELAYRDPDERDRLAPVVRHLLENTRLLLESGHFSVDPTALRAGVQRLRVRVEVVERAGGSDPDGDPNELRELEYEAPTATKPGRGSFALNSGRRVIGWVYVE